MAYEADKTDAAIAAGIKAYQNNTEHKNSDRILDNKRSTTVPRTKHNTVKKEG